MLQLDVKILGLCPFLTVLVFFPIYFKDFNLYWRLIKIYVFLRRENDLDWCIKILYPITIESTFFIEKVCVMCETLIYLAICKEYQFIAVPIYRYPLNIIDS